MTFKTRTDAKQNPQWHDIVIGPNEEFQVYIRNPTFEEQLHDMESEKGYTIDRLELIVDWNDLLAENSDPIPFSKSNLAIVCQHHPFIFRELCILVGRKFHGTDRATVKNSNGTQGQSSTDENTQAVPSSVSPNSSDSESSAA